MSSSPASGELGQDGILHKQLKTLLELGKYEEAERFTKDKCKDEILSSSSDFIQMLGQMINTNTYDNNYDLFRCCERILYHIAEVALPDESVIDFMEFAEQNDDVLFSVSLKAMQITLLKVIDKKNNAVFWCLVSIIKHINDAPQTEEFQLEGEECVLLENTDSSLKLVEIYKNVLEFLDPLISISLNNEISDEDYSNELKSTLVTFLIALLGRPVIYMDLEIRKIKSEFRVLAERIIDRIIKFKWELTHFLNYVSPFSVNTKKSVSGVEDIGFHNLSLGVLYYLVFKENVGLDYISHVNHPLFLLENVVIICLDMLSIENGRVQNKGLLLLESVLPRISDCYLDSDIINGELFGKLSESLSTIMIYSNVQENRKIAVRTFKTLLIKFNSQGRYYILYNIQNKVNNPNFTGYLVTITKDFVVETLSKGKPMDLKYFTGENLCNILNRFCKLPSGPETDLIEFSDQIIAALNFVRFLLLRDKENTTGLSNFIPKFEEGYIKVLKMGLKLAVAHYKMQITELKNTPPDEKFNVTVGGLELPSLSNDQKLGVLEKALTTFDIMESLVARVEECLEDFKLTMA